MRGLGLSARAVFAVAALYLSFGWQSEAQAELTFTPFTTEAGTVILVDGEFAYPDSLARFEQLVSQRRPAFVTFNSPGGNPLKAMELGRLIREFDLNTIQLRQFECASACALAFMGGLLRSAEPGAIGVHRSSFRDVEPVKES